MEAHAGTISIGTGIKARPKPKARRLQLFRERARARRRNRAIRAHAVAQGVQVRSVPGSEHGHLLLPPKAY
jgi:hypothetical protein